MLFVVELFRTVFPGAGANVSLTEECHIYSQYNTKKNFVAIHYSSMTPISKAIHHFLVAISIYEIDKY